MMKERKYEAPAIKVVAFTIEQGFVASPPRSEAFTPSNTNRGLEDVDASDNSLTNYFNY